MYGVPAIIVYNKIDLLEEEDHEELQAIQALYEQIEYPVLHISCEDEKGLDQVETLLKNKTTLISGHSGVGKSTLINKLIPDLDLRTLEVSDWSGKGMHTTTFAQMYDLPFGGTLIDTPGIRELGIANLKPEELSGYYREMKKILPSCKYNNCLHINEPSCAVLEGVKNLSVHPLRYHSYLSIYESLPKKNY
jgi:ribosome biogenesis GTPase